MPTPQYAIGDTVWVIEDTAAAEFRVAGIRNTPVQYATQEEADAASAPFGVPTYDQTSFEYLLDNGKGENQWFTEAVVFETKDALTQSL